MVSVESAKADAKNNFAAFMYEMLGTMFIMYAMMVTRGIYIGAPIVVTFAMMCLAWNVSGGQFNPAITLSAFVSQGDYVKNLIPTLFIIVGQFIGSMLGVFVGFLAIIDATYMQDLADARGEDKQANVPEAFVNKIAPLLPDGTPDLGYGEEFTRNWQTFYGIFVASIVLTLAYNTIRDKATTLTENELLKIYAIWIIQGGCAAACVLFGIAGINPPIACAYIMFETSQFDLPNNVYSNDELNHYVWAYLLAPIFGGLIGGFLHIVHKKCLEKGGQAAESAFE